MYYNEELKRWVVKGEEIQASVDSKQVPPPPMITSAQPLSQEAGSSGQSTGKVGWNQKNATHLYTDTPGICLKEPVNNNESIYLTPSHLKQSIYCCGSNSPFNRNSNSPLSVATNFIPQTPFNTKGQVSPQSNSDDNKQIFQNDASPLSNNEYYNKNYVSSAEDEELNMCSDFPTQSNNTLGSGESQCQLLSNSSLLQSEVDTFEYKSPVVARDTGSLCTSRKSTVHRQLTIQSRSTSIAHGSGVPIYDVSNEEYEKFKKTHIHDLENTTSIGSDINADNSNGEANSLINASDNSPVLNNNIIENTYTCLDKCVGILEKIKSTNLGEVFTSVNSNSVGDKIFRQNIHLMQIIQNLYAILEDAKISQSSDRQASIDIDNKAILTIDSKISELMGIMNNYQNKIFSICNMIRMGGDYNSVKLDIIHVESLLNKLEGVKNKIIMDLKSQGITIDDVDKDISELESKIESLKTSCV